jgi:hypothetical protein
LLGVGFLVGITQGVYEPEDLEGHDSCFPLGMVMAPGAACLAAWLYRNQLEEPATPHLARAGRCAKSDGGHRRRRQGL